MTEPTENAAQASSEAGAVASPVIDSPEPLVVWRCTAFQPLSDNALNGSSLTSVIPAGSFGHAAPEGTLRQSA